MSDLIIEDTKEVWIGYTNTDLTEGRGYEIPIVISESESTVRRFVRGQGVMGSDGHVKKTVAVKVDGRWLSEVEITSPTKQDKENDAARKKKQDAIERAKAAGLTDEDIKNLCQ